MDDAASHFDGNSDKLQHGKCFKPPAAQHQTRSFNNDPSSLMDCLMSKIGLFKLTAGQKKS